MYTLVGLLCEIVILVHGQEQDKKTKNYHEMFGVSLVRILKNRPTSMSPSLQHILPY